MALTRKFLRDKGIEDEDVVQAIIDAHMETVTPLKAYQTEAERLQNLLTEEQSKRQSAENALATAAQTDYKAMYDDLVAKNAERETAEKKKSALAALLDDVGLSPKGKELALKYTDPSTITLGEDGTIQNEESIKTAVLSDFGEYRGKVVTSGAKIATPPASASRTDMDSLSDEDYYKTIYTKKE